MHKEVKFGIMCQGMTLCKWQADAIEKILKLENIKLSLRIIENKEHAKKRTRILKKNTQHKEYFMDWI